MMLKLTAVEPDGVVRLATTGPLDTAELGGADQHPIADLVGDDWPNNRLVINLKQTDYVDSSAVGWLLSCAKAVRGGDGKIVLCGLSPSVKDVFSLMKIDTVLPAAADENAALLLLREEA